jgi:hypothetical protein
VSDLVARAQLVMLAETLGIEPERLRHLERFDSDQLRALRERISDLLFDEHAAVFARLNKLAPLVPNPVVARLSQALVPPLVAGRAAGALGVANPDRAAGVLSDLSPGYMADCAPYLDPRTIAVLAPRVPIEVLVPAANELMRRQDYVAASFFLDYASAELVLGFERGIPDKAGLLRTTALVQSGARLNEIVRVLPRERIEAIVRTAVSGPPELLLAGLSVLSRVEPELTAALGEVLLDQLDDDRLTVVLRTAVDSGATAELLAVATALPAEARRRLSTNAYLNPPETDAAAGLAAALRPDPVDRAAAS